MPGKKVKADEPVYTRDWAAIKAELQEAREKELANRVEFQSKVLSGEWILRASVATAIGNVFSGWRTQVLCADTALGDIVSSTLGVQSQSHTVRSIMQKRAYEMINEMVERIQADIKNA